MSAGERLLDLMENLPDDMLEEAWNVRKAQSGKIRKTLCWIAAAACIVILFLTFVPAGQAMAAWAKERIELMLEQWFPPREIPTFPEGEDYIIRKKPIAYTREDAMRDILALLEGLSQEEAEQKIQERMEEAQRFYESLPVCEIRITQMSQITPDDAAAKLRGELLQKYETVSEPEQSPLLDGLYMHGAQGNAFDDEVIEIHIVDDGLGGVFVIKAFYYVEAAEGVGARFHTMIGTFQTVKGRKPYCFWQMSMIKFFDTERQIKVFF